MGTSLTTVMLRLDDWGWSFQKLEPPPKRFWTAGATGADWISQIAAQLTRGVVSPDGDILRKSIQELLLHIAGPDPERTADEARRRLVAFIQRHGPASLLRRFLYLHVFNVVWLNTSEAFRLRAWTPNSFLDDMNQVEKDCRRTVRAIWRSLKMTGPLDPTSAAQLIQRIRERLNSQ